MPEDETSIGDETTVNPELIEDSVAEKETMDGETTDSPIKVDPDSSVDEIAATTTTETPPGACHYEGALYENRESVPSSQVCNDNCVCTEGEVTCTRRACLPTPPAFLRCDTVASDDPCCPTYECRKYTICYSTYPIV